MRIVKYITARGVSATELDRDVNGLIEMGFQPLGGPYVFDREPTDFTSFGLFQAMVLDDEAETKMKAEEGGNFEKYLLYMSSRDET